MNESLENVNENSQAKNKSGKKNTLQKIANQKEFSLKLFKGDIETFLKEPLSHNQITRIKVFRTEGFWENDVHGIVEGENDNYQVVKFERQFKFIGTKARIVALPYKKLSEAPSYI